MAEPENIFFIDFVLQPLHACIGNDVAVVVFRREFARSDRCAVGEQLVFVALAGEDAGLGIDGIYGKACVICSLCPCRADFGRAGPVCIGCNIGVVPCGLTFDSVLHGNGCRIGRDVQGKRCCIGPKVCVVVVSDGGNDCFYVFQRDDCFLSGIVRDGELEIGVRRFGHLGADHGEHVYQTADLEIHMLLVEQLCRSRKTESG
ncbi:MAG: hypothetical protein ACLRSE_15305 [Alistipes finegoldii]